MSEHLKKIHNIAEQKMKGSIHTLEEEFKTVRTGRANPAILENVRVEAYGNEMPINQLANITTPDARSIMVAPWDKGTLSSIERAIIAANLGFNPTNDGAHIRISIPPMTEERRKEMVKTASKMAEEARVAIRHVRKHSNDDIKKMEKEHSLPEDLLKTAHDQLQKITDDHIKKVDEHLKKKEKEIMEI